jgi:hypothetical protein
MMQDDANKSAKHDVNRLLVTQGLLAVTQILLQFPRNDANDGSDGQSQPMGTITNELHKSDQIQGGISLMFLRKHGSCVDVRFEYNQPQNNGEKT